jgi:hypothetical protein
VPFPLLPVKVGTTDAFLVRNIRNTKRVIEVVRGDAIILRIHPTTGCLSRHGNARVFDNGSKSRDTRDVIFGQFGKEELRNTVLIDKIALMDVLARREPLGTWVCRRTWKASS